MSPSSPKNRFPDWLKERGGTSVSSAPPFSNSRPGGAGETTEFLTAPHGAPESPPLSLRIGCALVFEAISETSFLLNVLPQIERTQVLVEERFMLGRGMSAETVEINHGYRLLRVLVPPGQTEFRHDALVLTPPTYDIAGITTAAAVPPGKLPAEVLRYTLPSRYCESDKLLAFAWETFGHLDAGWPRVRAICEWVHQNIEYRFGSGQSDFSALDVFLRRYGVCRDLAHLTIALCRALNTPARYATGHLPDIGHPGSGTAMDFHAYAEVYLGGRWFPIDARHNVPRIGRVKTSHGLDAVDCAFATNHGQVFLAHVEVWAYQIEPGTVSLDDPIDLSKRLDGTPELRHRRPS